MFDFKEDKIENLKEKLTKFKSIDEFIENDTKKSLLSLTSDLKQAHNTILDNLEKVLEHNKYDSRFKDYSYFEDYCYKLKKDFRSDYKFNIIQEATEEIISIEINTSTRNFNLKLRNYKTDVGSYFYIDEKTYSLESSKISEISLLDNTFNLEKMIKQIVNKNTQNKSYKLDLRSNKNRFLLSIDDSSYINKESSKIDVTIKKIENVISTNFDKKAMDSLWVSEVFDDRNFCDVIYALYEHNKNNDNAKFHAKLKKTAKALNLSTQTLTPFLIKYFILLDSYFESKNKHLKKLSKIAMDGELEEKTNIEEVAQGKVKADRNRFCLSTDKKDLISSRLEVIDFDKQEIDYIKLLDELKSSLDDEQSTSNDDFIEGENA